MPCAHPIPAVQPRFGGRVVLGHREIREFEDRADSVLASSSLLLPCGSCVGCQLSRARSWAIRCSLELPLHESSSFVTLTYADAHVPLSLSRKDLSWVFRSLRKRGSRFRFFACGEYGEQKQRPHYHALLFGAVPREELERVWAKGFVTQEAVTPGRISYTAGYCLKKVGEFAEKGERVDYSTGELYDYQPPFIQMSRRPGIGGDARRHWRSWRSFAIHSGQKVPVPRFLAASYREHASASELAALELEKLESRMSPTIRELDAHEAIARQRVASTLEGRVL